MRKDNRGVSYIEFKRQNLHESHQSLRLNDAKRSSVFWLSMNYNRWEIFSFPFRLVFSCLFLTIDINNITQPWSMGS